MLFDITRPVLGAGEVIARIAALVIDTCKAGRAAAIPQANGNGRRATFDADADRFVVEDLASFVGGGARIADGARALTPSRHAGQVGRAVVVDATFDRIRTARHLTGVVQDEAVLADAQRPVVSHLAPFALVAHFGAEVARILARSDRRVAGLASVTLTVPGATHHGL